MQILFINYDETFKKIGNKIIMKPASELYKISKANAPEIVADFTARLSGYINNTKFR